MTIEIADKLKKIGDKILEIFHQKMKEDVQKLLNFEDYHGFQKSRLPHEFLHHILEGIGLNSEEMQIEIVGVVSDLKDQVHYHKYSTAYIYVLGEGEKLPPPKNAYTYQDGSWIPIKEGCCWMIQPKTAHGFTVDKGGVLYFLSVQSPPIVHHDMDDYYPVKNS